MQGRNELQMSYSIPEYFNWLEEVGIRPGKIEPADFDGLRGMRSVQGITPGDVLVELPIAATICVGDDQPCPIPDWVDQRFWYVCSMHVRLAMLLLYELSKGEKSSFYPWILSLPATHDDKLARWTKSELDELQDEFLAADAVRQRDSIDGVYDALRASSPNTPVPRNHPHRPESCLYHIAKPPQSNIRRGVSGGARARRAGDPGEFALGHGHGH